jgi:hypothetical protein
MQPGMLPNQGFNAIFVVKKSGSPAPGLGFSNFYKT